jgi:3-deoxy-manno-octulosonate cytidylyltransferase (CMP-KDO synthetase)
MNAVGVIPARFDGSRFPGKLLAEIDGAPLLRRVWEGACHAKSLRAVLVATDDDRIAAACAEFGARVVRTQRDHATGSDRVAEVAESLPDEIIVNIQGDEPTIAGFVVDAAVEALREDESVSMATVVHAAPAEALDDPNRVKVAIDRRGRALYFSRSRIPASRTPEKTSYVWQHVGIYAFRRPFLRTFAGLAQGVLERSERLEQLRALEHGHAIRCAIIEGWCSTPVDVPADIPRVEKRLREVASRR